jgi:organic hydroperoxide reductase OsmC/OhrA
MINGKQTLINDKQMNLISLYTARARATGRRSGGTVVTDDGAFAARRELPPELGGDAGKAENALNPEQLFACAWAASIADAINFAAKQRNLILRRIEVSAAVTFGQYENDGFGIRVEFAVRLPELPAGKPNNSSAKRGRLAHTRKRFAALKI